MDVREALCEVRVRRWTRREYHRAAEVGLFGPDERLELIRGDVIQMPPQKSAHFTAICAAAEALSRALVSGWYVRQQGPLAMGEDSEPEPDLAVVRGSWRDYAGHHPTPQDVSLIVEVSDTTLRLDRLVKGPLYAERGIGEYWILNLPDRLLEVYRDPAPREEGSTEFFYRKRLVYGGADRIPVGEHHLAVEDLFPPPT